MATDNGHVHSFNMSLIVLCDAINTVIQFRSTDEIDELIKALQLLKKHFQTPDMHIHLMSESRKERPIAGTEVTLTTVHDESLNFFSDEFILEAQSLLDQLEEENLKRMLREIRKNDDES